MTHNCFKIHLANAVDEDGYVIYGSHRGDGFRGEVTDDLKDALRILQTILKRK